MKKCCVTNVLKKLAFPAVFCGVLWLGSSAYAVSDGDIVSIESYQKNLTFTDVGVTIGFRVTLDGKFNLQNVSAVGVDRPEFQMVVNGDGGSPLGVAVLESLTANTEAGPGVDRTDCLFTYTTKPGDMAQPLKIFGSPTIPYRFDLKGWEIRSATNALVTAVWKWGWDKAWTAYDVNDLTLSGANITVRTLAFEVPRSLFTVSAGRTTNEWVTSGNPVGSATVGFVVWTPGTNILQIDSSPLSILGGSNSVPFQVRGLTVGTTDVYLQRTMDYANNSTVGVTNYIKRSFTVTEPPAPPEPTVYVVYDSGDTLAETSILNTGSFHLELSEAFTNDVWVRIDLPTTQSNVTFASSPVVVRVPMGATSSFPSSPLVKFSVPDGTTASDGVGLKMTTVVTNGAAAAKYSGLPGGTVYVTNVKPVVQTPSAKSVTRGVSTAFSCTVTDASIVDVAAGMTNKWTFNDGAKTFETNVNSLAGPVYYAFTSPVTGTGTNTVTITATDKDGAESAPVSFTVTVIQPIPKPSVRVVPSSYVYSETSTNLTGSVMVYLSETFNEDVWVSLTTTPAGQSNIVFSSTEAIVIPTGATNALADLQFSIPDGTVLSETAGIDIIPTVTNDLAKAYYTSLLKAKVAVKNLAPKITKPALANLPASYSTIPMSTPFGMQYAVADVPADAPDMVVTWEFDNGVTQITKTGSGLTGLVYPDFPAMGDWTVTVKAHDMDGGVADEVQFMIKVVAPLPLPTVSVIPPPGPLDETATPSTGQITVHLSETFTNSVTVQLNVTPTNSAAYGTMVLATNRVVIQRGQTDFVVKFSAYDGTAFSRDTGFLITPVVLGTTNAVSYFTEAVPGLVQLLNVAPVITTPLASSTTGPAAYTIPQGTDFMFYWDVNDVVQDLPSMSVTWYFGDGAPVPVTGGSGSILHRYTATGDMVVRVVALDKDGGRNEVQFKITVSPSKMVTVDPTGPSVTDYYGMRARTGLSPEGGGGIGYGRVRSPDALGSNFVQDVYTFTYSPNLSSARLIATAYTNSMNVLRSYENEATYLKPTGLIFDSFFFVWDGADQGLIAGDLDPRTASASPSITLPAAQTGVGTTTTPTGVETRQVRAIFSQEWLTSDNYGDINCDGIPDVVATLILDAINAGGAGGTTTADSGQSPAWLTRLDTYNGDNDFEPVNPTGIGGTFDFRPVANATGGNGFLAITELRGDHMGLNMPDSDRSFSSTEPVQNPLITDEPKTDATKADTDADGFPDGYEYWFWFRARMRLMTGAAFNPADISVGTFIPSRAIELYFEPFTRGVSNGDLDQDGLSDVEELTIGTNPTHWDTDGDGICDKWEVLRGLNPSVKDSSTANPDGDFMAYAIVTRELVTAGGVTYLSDTPIAGGAPLAFSGGNFTTAYHYGDSNALLAAGCAVVPPVGALASAASVPVNALLLHFQVLREFGFDPRTAWTHSVNFRDTFERIPTWMNVTPHTKAYTSLDEYLLYKFMAETLMNGATPSASSINWASYTTDPLTPDSDVDTPEKGKNDGMPDGWELYVSVDPSLDLTDPANRVMGISPWNDLDGDLDSEPAATTPAGAFIQPRDGVVNRREFGGTDSSARYADAKMYVSTAQSNKFLNVVSITQPAVDVLWWNKFWPTNPWNHDTDGDGLSDLAERAFMYGTTVDSQTTCTQGGGLNPDSVDTDLDALPDGWEFEFKGTVPTVAATYSGMVITNGMDGTVGLDFNQDWDSDGLLNYQEYWTQAVRGFRYDITAVGTTSRFLKPGQPMDDSFEPSSLFTVVSNSWDRAQLPWGISGPVLHVLLPLVNMYSPANNNALYATTDPRDYDTDLDGMDDYYEMYHGLNPLLGDPINDDNIFVVEADRVAKACIINGASTIDYNINDWGSKLLLNFVTFPWMVGLPEADVDGDGLRNFEEKLQPNTAAPSYSNTDPTPLWLTDESNTNSATARFFHPMGYRLSVSKLYSDADSMFYWPPLPFVPPAAVYTFERTEGYDTDNDGVSDKAEMVNAKNGLSDPQDFDDTIRRQAIWFSGTNSAASSTADIAGGEWTLRSFTAELWARPENVTTQQVLLERVFAYSPSDLSTTGKVLRCNFRIGIANGGKVYGMFENAGAHDDHTATVCAYGNVLTSNEWAHIAVKMDGVNSAFSLLVNGDVRDTVTTTLIPANGLLIVRSSPTDPETTTFYTVIPGSMMVGAKDDKPKALKDQVWSDYSQFYQGYIDEVRIWDGARDNVAIKSDYKRRFTKSDLISNRLLVRSEEALGYSRVWTNPLQLAPELLFHYTFDNLFSADTTNDVATSPRGFNSLAVTINRPTDALCTWWDLAKIKSTVYTDYQYMPWIENSVSHLPIFGSAVQSANNRVTVIMTNTVANSVYWTHTRAGKIAGVFEFPNSNNPYDNSSDLVPMGAAFAKSVPDMWDEQGVSGVWSETGTDVDFDGLPDWWELYVSGSTTGVDWTAINPGLGMSFGEQYQRDIANGMTPGNNPLTSAPGNWTTVDNNSDGIVDSSTPTVTNPVKRQTADSDHDGMPNWWEIMYGLNPNDATAKNGADGDLDNDRLSNYYEYLSGTDPLKPDSDSNGVLDFDEDADLDGISSGEELVYGTNPANVDTDNDGLKDSEEIQLGTDPLNPLSPYVRRTLVNDGTGYLTIPKAPVLRGQILDNDGSRFNLSDWTLSARVKLATNPVSDVILIQRLVTSANQDMANYELGIDHSTLKPYVRFQTSFGKEYRLNSYKPLATNEWTQIGGRLGPSTRTGFRRLSLFSDYNTVTTEDISEGACVTNKQSGDLMIAKNLIGEIDEVQIWSQARTDNEIELQRGRTLLFGYVTNEASYVDSTGVTSTYTYGLLGRGVLSSGVVALYLPFDDGRQFEYTNANLDAQMKVSSVDNFVHYAEGWQQIRSYAGTLVGGIDFSPLTNSVIATFSTEVGSDQSIDSDGDGMSDAFEVFYGLDPDNSGITGAYNLGPDGDLDGDGLPNLYEYYAGTDTWVADTNGDGINDAETDSDGDRLSNIVEYRMGSHPMRTDTDDDGFNDGEEVQGGSNPVFSDSPGDVLKSMRLNGTATYQIPSPEVDRKRFNNAAWTVEMWVRPDTATQTGTLFKYTGTVSTNGVPRDVVFYELGLSNGVPYVRMDTGMFPPVVRQVNGGTLQAGEWTHVAGTYDPAKNALTLYLDGMGVASLMVSESGQAGSATANVAPGKAFIGSVAGVSGNIDELRIWKRALTQDEIFAGIEHLVPAGDNRLVCYFRFDDGGLTAEDYAHPIRPPRAFNAGFIVWPGSLDTPLLYCMGGIIFDASTAYTGTRQESDDADGDKLPDWWEAFALFREVAYPITEVVWHNEETTTTNSAGGVTNVVTTVKRIETNLRVKEERTEIINAAAERSSSVLDLGWRIAYGTVWSVPLHFSAFYQKWEGRWCQTPDSAWLFNDVYMTAEQVATAELRFNLNDRSGAGSEIYINGKLIKVADLQQPQYQFTYVPFEDATIQVDWWEDRSKYALDADYVKQGQYFKVGWNRIAVKHNNSENPVTEHLMYDQFSLSLTADRGETTLISSGARWWIFAYAGSRVEPPLDAAGRVWSDPEYGLDTNADPDGDKLANEYEAMVGTNPNSTDSDGDGVPDGNEDMDGDGLQNVRELLLGTNPRLPDTDDDGLRDSEDGYMGGSVSWATNSLLPLIDRYLCLNGTNGNSYLEAPLVPRWGSGTNSFTLRLSVQPDVLPAAGTTNFLAMREVSSGVYNYALQFLPDGRVAAIVTVDTGVGVPQQITVTNSAALTLHTWSQVDMVVDLQMQRLLLLVNGASSASAFCDMRKLPATSGAGLVHTRFGVGFVGALDNIAFYHAALSADILALVREQGILAYPTVTIQGCYLFDDGTSAVGVSGVPGWSYGQVQDFACLFWSADSQTAAGFTLRDWQTGWHNAGSLVGVQCVITDDPVNVINDRDYDGMPDIWEMKYGLDPYDNTGVNGALGDPDRDGLSNYSEYLISEVYGFYPGLSPNLFSTSQTVSDYFLKAGALYYGEMFSDHDYMEDSWEDLWPLSYISRFVYDPLVDADQDGWSSWAECRYGSDPTTGIGTNAIPVPVMTFNLSYNGFRDAGTVLVYSYSTAGMEGNPSAVYSAIGQIGAWPLTLTVPIPSSGYIHEGMNYFFGMIDLNNNGLWDAGEPCGVADGFGVEIGWDRNIVNIDLKDYAPNYLRMTMNPAVRSEDVLFNGVSAAAGATVAGLETRIRIMRKYINGTFAASQRLVLDKTVYAPRSFIHDGDFLQMGTPGLDWGFPGEIATVQSAVYQVFRNSDVNVPVLTFTNSFDMVRAKAVATYPANGAFVYSSRPTFKWTMPKEYTAFTLEILKGSSGNPVIYNSGVVMAPVRDAAGNCVWTAPIYAGDRVPSTGLIFSSNTAYAWRVIAMNPKFSTAPGGDVTWSDQKMFRLDVNPPVNSSGFGAIQARVKYFGPATNLLALSNRVRVQAFRNRGFAGIPEAQYTLTTNDVAAMLTPNATNVNAVLRGLAMSTAVGDCYLRAFIDHNTNGVRDAWESWGYPNYYGINDKAYAPFPVKVEFKSSILVYDICIEDADTDQDWYPDAWEYQEYSSVSSNFLGYAGQGTATNPDAEVNPDLMVSPFAVSTNLVRVGLSGFSSALALTTSDMDGDGLSDMTELIMGSNVGAASTSGDGFADGAKVSLGLSPSDFLTLNMTGLSMGTLDSQVQWNVEVQKAAATSRSLLSTLANTPNASYEVQYKASLSVGDWRTVADGTVTLDGVQPAKITPVSGIGQGNTAQGFFRVLLKP